MAERDTSKSHIVETGGTTADAPPVLILAPIRGITDVVYRDAYARSFGGFDRAVAPFIQLRQGKALRPAELAQVAPERNRPLPVTPQVLTRDAEVLAAALGALHDAGHSAVDWNLGCPHPTVAGRGRGAGLLAVPERIDAILTRALRDSPVRLSVKIRLGYRDPDEYVAVMDVLNRHPLREVTLHARTADQMYGGAVDLERAAAAMALCRHPFVYNGDITSPGILEDLRRRLPGATGWMIGRGALHCPFLPRMIKAGPGAGLPEAPQRRAQLRMFHDQLLEGYAALLSGPGHLLDRMKEQWRYLARSFARSERVGSRIRRSDTVDAYVAAVDRAFRDSEMVEAGSEGA